jgi:hypothetical protein
MRLHGVVLNLLSTGTVLPFFTFYSILKENDIRDRIVFRPHSGQSPAQLGPLETDNFNQWSQITIEISPT